MDIGALGKDDFLNLFVSQLKYQDPMNPMDNTQFTAQLAQFSTLEQLYNMNNTMEKLVNYQESLNNGMLSNLIGRQIRTADGSTEKVLGISFDNGVTNLMTESSQRIPVNEVLEIY